MTRLQQNSNYIKERKYMNIKKSLVAAGVTVSLAGAGLAGTSLVSAQSNSSGADSLVNKIAQKFNLKTTDVQAVFDEDKSARQAEKQVQVEKDLAQAVTDGKITAAQKDAIIAKQKELQSQMEASRESMKSKTDEERKAAMDSKRTELEKWAKDNNIPTEFLRYIHGPGGHGHGGPERM